MSLAQQIVDAVGELGCTRVQLEVRLPKCSKDALGLTVYQLRRAGVLEEDRFGVLKRVPGAQIPGPAAHHGAAAEAIAALRPPTRTSAEEAVTATPAPANHQHSGNAALAQTLQGETMAKTKKCKTCGKEKALEEFGRANRSPDLRTADCNSCRGGSAQSSGKKAAPPPAAKKGRTSVPRKAKTRRAPKPVTAAPVDGARTVGEPLLFLPTDEGISIARAKPNGAGLLEIQKALDITDAQLDAIVRARDAYRKAAA